MGEHTSEWAYDREDIRRQIKNRRAPVATSYVVKDNRSTFNGHTYVGTLKLPEKARITGGELTMPKLDSAPDLTLSVFHISLANQNQSFPLRAAWITREGSVSEPAQRAETVSGGRWRRLKEFKRVSIFENANALPRAWLASEALTLNENQILAVVRSGALPNGSTWNPQQSALVETQLALPRKANTPDPGEIAKAEVTKHEPNGLEIHTASAAPSVLVLSENYFPGWRVNVDGQPAQLLRVNYNLRGVALPAGEHVVSFQYRPWSVLIGAIVSLLTLTGLLLAPKARNLKTWGQRRK